MDFIISNDDSESREEVTLALRKKALISGKVRTTDSSVLHKVTWPYEVMYTVTSKPAEYKGISIPCFISEYLVAMATEKLSVHPLMVQHLRDLMSEAKLYGWEPARDFQCV